MDTKYLINQNIGADVEFKRAEVQTHLPHFVTYVCRTSKNSYMTLKHPRNAYTDQPSATVNQLSDWATLSMINGQHASKVLSETDMSIPSQEVEPFRQVDTSPMCQYDEQYKTQNYTTEHYRYHTPGFVLQVTPPEYCKPTMSPNPYLYTVLNTTEWNPRIMDRRFLA